MGSHGYIHGFGLQHLTHIQKLFEIFRYAVIPAHVFFDAQVTDAAALMWSHDIGFDIVIFRYGVFFYRFKFRERLESVFAEKPAEFDPRKYLGPARDNMEKLYKHKILNVLGSDNKLAE